MRVIYACIDSIIATAFMVVAFIALLDGNYPKSTASGILAVHWMLAAHWSMRFHDWEETKRSKRF